jgi:hypothetical protein
MQLHAGVYDELKHLLLLFGVSHLLLIERETLNCCFLHNT